ncbi:phage major capsid protein [Babesia caballi]|uniref:Phage major capsid protein n=1 Tax=Babesia caballi TaxID=5871 RepID=A0AAV4LVQ3_BABCB|nr:phage major capsid protein [Babesia caballi]
MTKDGEGNSLNYTVLKLPIPSPHSHRDHEATAATDVHRIISGFHLSTSTPSFRLPSIGLGALCSAKFVTQLLLPHRLRLRSDNAPTAHQYKFSLSFDEGLHLQVSHELFDGLGLSNTTKLHRHKGTTTHTSIQIPCPDDFVTVGMDVTAPGYLKEDSKLRCRTVAALDRLPPCATLVSPAADSGPIATESLLAELRRMDPDVACMEPVISVTTSVTDRDSNVLNSSDILSHVDNILERGGLPDPPTVPASTPAHGAARRTPGEHAKRRKVVSSEDDAPTPPDGFDHFLQHKEVLFKAHRTLSQEKNWKLETLRNVMRELDKAGVHQQSPTTIVHLLRYAIDGLVLRALASRGAAADSSVPQPDGSEHTVSLLTGSLTPSETLFEMFLSAW